MSTEYFRDKASEQIVEAGKIFRGDEIATNITGTPMASLTATLTVGPTGNALLQDSNLLDHLAHFDRERIPERVEHAKGAGAFGYFEVTDDITRYTRAKVFERVGKKTPIAVRLSTTIGESGFADTIRSPRGFAIKFYTEEGNWDLVGNNTPIFFIRDPMLFPSFTHCQKRNPVTHLHDANMYWDFVSLQPETTNQIMFLFSDRGIPDGFRHMHGYGNNIFKLVNAKMKAVYVKFHMRTDQGIKNLTPEKAEMLRGLDLDYFIRDLYNAIESKKCPSWTFYIQVMTFKQAETYHWNPFDVTKLWPYEKFPMIRVGKIVLDQNPTNYFAQVEQASFAPSNLVPGIEPSPDKVLQGRLFSYVDSSRHRLGANYQQLPVNRARTSVKTYNRDGPMEFTIPSVGPNYFPNSFNGPKVSSRGQQSVFPLAGDVKRYNSDDDDNYSQPAIYWENSFDDAGRKRLVENIAESLQYAVRFIRDRVVDNFTQVNSEFGRMLQESLDEKTED